MTSGASWMAQQSPCMHAPDMNQFLVPVPDVGTQCSSTVVSTNRRLNNVGVAKYTSNHASNVPFLYRGASRAYASGTECFTHMKVSCVASGACKRLASVVANPICDHGWSTILVSVRTFCSFGRVGSRARRLGGNVSPCILFLS